MEQNQTLKFDYFESHNARLFSVLHIPAVSNGQGFVLCSPFAEEKLRTYRVVKNLADRFASQGYCVLRFDYMGEGDSDGRFDETTVDTRVANILDALAYLKATTQCDRLGLFGMRFGATLAVRAAAQSGRMGNLLLWQPIVQCEEYFFNMLRANLALQTRAFKKILYDRKALIEQMQAGNAVNIEGYLWKWPLYEQAAHIDLCEDAKRVLADSFILQISKAPELRKEMLELHAALKHNQGRHAIEKTGQEFLWEDLKLYNPRPETCFQTTMKWLADG